MKPACDSNVKVIPFCVPLPSSSSLEAGDQQAAVDPDFGVVGTVTLRGPSAVVWFGWGALEEGEGSDAAVAEDEHGRVSVGTGKPPMGPLALSMPPSIRGGRPVADEVPTSQLLGGLSEEDMILGQQISARLAKRVGWPVFVSCSLGGWGGGPAGSGAPDAAASARFDDSATQRAAALAEREVSRILLREKVVASEPQSLDPILKVAKEAALLAGATMREALLSSDEVQLATKSSSTDLVTQTDEKCEQIATKLIQSNFPDHKIIGEESSGSDKYQLTAAPTWTIDPIDGTTNFVHRLKLSCVIISHLIDKEVHVAVIYDPYADELFHAVKGKGSYMACGGKDPVPIHVSKTDTIENAVISMDPGYGRDKEAVGRYIAIQSAILSRSVRNIRVIGSTGLNMAFIACGRLDGGFEEGSWDSNRGPKIWDFAAGKLLVEEAGGVTRDLESPLDEGMPLDLMKRSFFCAANPALAESMIDGIVEGRSTYNQDNL
ncbi:hypothetical protein ACHAWF_013140 [Thalassiosira exigua]